MRTLGLAGCGARLTCQSVEEVLDAVVVELDEELRLGSSLGLKQSSSLEEVEERHEDCHT